MAARPDELSAADVKYDCSLAQWAGLKQHMVKHFVNVRLSKMWEALVPEKVQAQWVMLRHPFCRG